MRVLLPFPHERRVLLILLPVPRRLPLPFPLARLDVADIPALLCGTPEVNPALVLLAVVHAATRLEALQQALEHRQSVRCRSWALLQHRGGAVRPLERQALEHRRARTPLPTAVGPAADADQTVGGAADADLQTVGPAAAPNVTTTAGSGAPPGAVTPPAALSWRWRGRRCSIRLRAARSPKPSASGSSSGTFALPPRRRSRWCA